MIAIQRRAAPTSGAVSSVRAKMATEIRGLTSRSVLDANATRVRTRTATIVAPAATTRAGIRFALVRAATTETSVKWMVRCLEWRSVPQWLPWSSLSWLLSVWSCGGKSFFTFLPLPGLKFYLLFCSRRWQREHQHNMGSPVFGYLGDATVKTPVIGQTPYQVTLEDRMRWAQIADVMAQANHYAVSLISAFLLSNSPNKLFFFFT